MPLCLPSAKQTLLAVGGQMKSAIAWHNGVQACLGTHGGDLESLAVFNRWSDQMNECQELYRFTPDLFVADGHPDYSSTRWVESSGRPHMTVQHHHAHVVSSMVGEGMIDEAVMGVAWDGTGFGDDGSVWGGEFLRATIASFERVGRLRPFRLLGGEAALREPWRLFASFALQACADDLLLVGKILGEDHVRHAQLLMSHASFSPWSTSAGRLFDAVAWFSLGEQSQGYDGRAGMMLESIADLGDQELFLFRSDVVIC